jgi:hypothetical protein
MNRPTAQARKRTATKLKARLDKGLLSYAVAASAAGVGLLALTQSAQAKIVYTPADVPILRDQIVPLDLNHDGIQDFFFFFSARPAAVTGTLSIDPVRPNNRILGSKLYASALPAGVSVGPGGNFQQEHDFMADRRFYYMGYSTRGPWTPTQDRYLGLKFFVQGQVHYGWARVQVFPQGNDLGFDARLAGYAYETTPNTAILTGTTSAPQDTGKNVQPDSASPSAPALAAPSLGLFAQGSRGLVAWRRTAETVAGK